jgi:hypothetical protein
VSPLGTRTVTGLPQIEQYRIVEIALLKAVYRSASSCRVFELP